MATMYTRPDATYPAVAEDGGRTAMSPADVGAGWSTSSQTRPPAATFNAKDYITSSAVKYLLRLGVAEYSPTESYQGLGLCTGSNGSIYWNLSPCTGIDPVTDEQGFWEKTAIRRADCAELIGNVTGGVIPETLNLLKGNGSGSAADSGILDDGTQTTFPRIVLAQTLRFNNTPAVGLPAGQAGFDFIPNGASSYAARLISHSLTANAGEVQFAGASSDNSQFLVYLRMMQPSGAGSEFAVFSVPLSIGNAGNLRLIDRAGPASKTGSATVGADTQSLVLNAWPTGAIYLNWDQGSAGVNFCNGAQTTVAHIDSAGNASFNGGVTTSGGLSVAGGSQIVPDSIKLSMSANVGYMDFIGPNASTVGSGIFRVCASDGSHLATVLAINSDGSAGFGGNLTLGGSLVVDNNSSGSIGTIYSTMPNLGVGQSNALYIGQSNTQNNIVLFGFRYQGYGNANNQGFISMGGQPIAATFDANNNWTFNGNIQCGLNCAGNTTIGAGALKITWNLGNGVGETDFLNSNGGAGGGFAWYSGSAGAALNSSSPYLMYLTGNGSLKLPGDLYLTGMTHGLRIGGITQTAGYFPDQMCFSTPVASNHYFDFSGTDASTHGVLHFRTMTGHAESTTEVMAISSTATNVAALQVGGGAPNNQVLMGNGSTYVPQNLTTSGAPNDQTGSRAFSGVYQNTTGFSLFVAVTATVGSGGGLLRAYVSPDNSTWYLVGGQDRVNAGGNNNLGGGANYAMMVSYIVPKGWFYQVQDFAGNTGNPLLYVWIENLI